MIIEEFKRGMIRENPIFRLALGLCPAIAITTTANNAIAMGIAVIFVLTCSNVVISLISKYTPENVRTPCFLVVIATAVTIVDLWMKTNDAELSNRLGIFIPLIAANCIILTRIQMYATKNNAFKAAIDGIVMGLGFSVSLLAIALLRELIGNNTFFGLRVVPGVHPLPLFLYAPGGFFTLAVLIWIANLHCLKKETDNQ
jgi:electron transport complex protein RnfE